MACGFDKGLIAAHYDGETTPEERLLVERHLATCSECARDLASMKSLSSALKPLAAPARAPMSIAEGVIREIDASRPARRPWKAWLTSAAAAVLLAVGTVYMLDRSQGSPSKESLIARAESKQPAASKPASPPHEVADRLDKSLRATEHKPTPEAHREMAEAPKSEAAPPPPPSAPTPKAPEPSEPVEPGRTGGAKAAAESEDLKQENRWQKAIVPVVRVTTPDPALARAVVEDFLKEREKRQVIMAATLLGRTTFVRDRYLQLELSEEESKELEKRLAALKETLVAPGSFEEEKKRVEEEAAKLKKADGTTITRPSADDKTDKDAESEKKEESAALAERSRRMGKAGSEVRKKVIFVFELPPLPKK